MRVREKASGAARSTSEGGRMKRALVSAGAFLMVLAPVIRGVIGAQPKTKEIVGLTPADVRWFTPPYYTDGRQRAQLFGDSTGDGPWVDRVRIPPGSRVLAHTHPHDELATVIEGTWYVGAGQRFDAAKLKAYPAGSFVVVPAGIPHFVAAKDGVVIVQIGGTGRFGTDYLEK